MVEKDRGHRRATPGPAAVDADPRPALARVLSWEQGRIRLAMPTVVRRCMSYSAMSCFDDTLVAAAKDFYGLDMDVATAEAEILEDDDERVRFFPWLLWDWRVAPGTPTIGERFLSDEEHAGHERRILEGLNASYVGFYEALDDATELGVSVRDLGTGEVLRITDDGLEDELLAGQLLQARLVRVRGPEGRSRDLCVLVDAVYAVLPAAAREAIEAEIESLPSELGGPAAALAACTAELLELAEHLLEALARPPAPLNADGERLQLCRTLLQGPAADAARATLERGARAFARQQDRVWRWREGDGFARVARDGHVTLGATSLDAIDRLEACLLSGPAVLRLRSVTDFATALEGDELDDIWLLCCPGVLDATRRWLEAWAASWADIPWLELGDLTPREAVRAPEGRRRVERALDRMSRVGAERAGMTATLELAALRTELDLA